MPPEKRKIAEFDNGYGTPDGEITVEDGACDVCGRKTRVITMDASGGEFASGAICGACVWEALGQDGTP